MKFLTMIMSLAAASGFSTNHASCKRNGPSCLTLNAVSRRGFFNGVAAAAAVSIAPQLAVAAGNIPPITGIYSDPNHKNGYRVVRAVNKSTAIVTLQDEPNGPIVTVDGKIKTSKKSGTTITLDLSKKGGPKAIEATVGGSDKLIFPDGNAWTKITGIDGVYFDPNHPKGYRVVRASQGSKIQITLQDDASGPVVELEGKRRGKGNLFIDFSPKGGPKNLAAIAKDDKLVFPDGNTWTKL